MTSLENWSNSTNNSGAYTVIKVSSVGTNAIGAQFTSGLWYTTNLGVIAQSTNTNGGGLVSGIFASLALSADGSKGVAGSYSSAGLWHTSTSGATWGQSTTSAGGAITGNFESVALSSDGSKGVASGTTGAGLWYTTNSGATWTYSVDASGNSITSGTYSVVLSTDGSKGILATTAGLLYTTTSGVSWFASNITSGRYKSLALSGTNGIAGSNSSSVGLLYTTDSGVNWFASNTTTGTFNVVALSGTNGVAGSNGNGGLLYTTDSGVNWLPSNITTGGFSSIALSSDGMQGIVAPSTNGLLYTTNSGTTWSQTTNSVDGSVITSGFLSVSLSSNGTIGVAGSNFASNTGVWYTTPPPPEDEKLCFLTGTTILTAEGEKKVEHLTEDDLVKTYKNGYKKISNITVTEMSHYLDKEIEKGDENNSLFVLKKNDFPELSEDLILTGDHQLLVDDLKTARSGGIDSFMKIDGKFGLRAYKEKNGKVYEKSGKYTVYDIAIGTRVYGIYANGLLVSSGVNHK